MPILLSHIAKKTEFTFNHLTKQPSHNFYQPYLDFIQQKTQIIQSTFYHIPLFYNINNKLRKGCTRFWAVFSWVIFKSNLSCELGDRLEEINPPFNQIINIFSILYSILTYFLIGLVMNRLFLSDLVSWTSRLQKWEFSSIFKRKKKADIWM